MPTTPTVTDPGAHLIETVVDGVATLTMNRPEARNAQSAEMSAGLEQAVPRLAGDYGGSYFLPRLVGAAKARELYFTAELIDAHHAQRIRLVNHVYADHEFGSAVDTWVARLAALPTIALGYMKKNLNAAERGSLGQVLDLEAQHMMRTFETEDHRSAAQAFVDKREPNFHAR